LFLRYQLYVFKSVKQYDNRRTMLRAALVQKSSVFIYGVCPCASYDVYNKHGLFFYTTLIHCPL